MEAIITLTPEYNINKETNAVIDNSLVFTIKRSWRSFIPIYNITVKKKYAVSIANLSVYNHKVFLEEVPHIVLYMLSKRIETTTHKGF